MAALPLDEAIPRFKNNESRFNDFVNGDDTTDMVLVNGQLVPSIRKFLTQMTVGGVIYASTAAGLAAVSDGQFFFVRGNGTTTFTLLYQRVNGAANLIAATPSSSALTNGPVTENYASGDYLLMLKADGSFVKISPDSLGEAMNYTDFDFSKMVGTTSSILIYPDDTRVSFSIGNFSLEGGPTIAINEMGGEPVINGIGSITLPPGAFYESSRPSKKAIKVIASADGAIVTTRAANRSGKNPNLQALMDEILSRQTTKLSGAKLTAATAFIESLLNAGIWDRIDHLWVPECAMNSSEARRDWKSGTAASILGTVDYTSGKGWTASGADVAGGGGFINTFKTLGAGKFSRYDAHMVIQVNSQLTSGAGHMIGDDVACIGSHRSATATAFRANASASNNVEIGGVGSFQGWSRRSAEQFTAYWKDKKFLVDRTTVSVGPRELYLLASNSPAGAYAFNRNTLGVASVGASLSDEQMYAYFAAISALTAAVDGL